MHPIVHLRRLITAIRLTGGVLVSTVAVSVVAAETPARTNDFPTTARVEYAIACIQESKAPHQEMLYKCSCAIDAIAQEVSYDDWVELSTIANAITIAGERGGALRDLKDGRKRVTAFKELVARARKSCFISE